jgi:hypothetical protein
MKILIAIVVASLLMSCSVEYKISHYRRPIKQTCIVGNKPF